MRTECLYILSLSRAQGKINSPSWLDRIWASHSLYERDRSGPWQATGSTKAATNFDQSRQLPDLSGHILDSIPCLRLTLTYDQSGYGMDFKMLEDWERVIWVFAAKVGYISGKSLLDAYWKTVILYSRLGRDGVLRAEFLR